MTHWIEKPANRCTYQWLRFTTAEGEHWAGCDRTAGHGGNHVAGVAWVSVTAEDTVTHRWGPPRETPDG